MHMIDLHDGIDKRLLTLLSISVLKLGNTLSDLLLELIQRCSITIFVVFRSHSHHGILGMYIAILLGKALLGMLLRQLCLHLDLMDQC